MDPRQSKHTVETSLGKAEIWIGECDAVHPNAGVEIAIPDSLRSCQRPTRNEAPRLRASVDRVHGKWSVTSGCLLYAEGAPCEVGQVPTSVTEELAAVATKWATQHPEQFERELQDAVLDIFRYYGACVEEALERMPKRDYVETDWGPERFGTYMRKANSAGLVLSHQLEETLKGFVALSAAKAAIGKARKHFAAAAKAA